MNTASVAWLFDLGNSRLKGAWLDRKALADPIALAWDEPGFEALLQDTASSWPSPRKVLVASVVGESRTDRMHAFLRGWPDAQIEWLQSPREGCGIRNRYRIPERLGIDRFLAMAAARSAAQGAAAIVVGCGTALTLDAIDADGVQQEGFIAPSPALMLQSLRGTTAIGETHPDAFGAAENDDTARALQHGCARAAAALVEWHHARHRQALGEPKLWMHGGGAGALRQSLQGETAACARILDDAVLRGLALWASVQS